MMDDIIVWGSTQEEHDTRLNQVLDKARKANLKLNKDKCEFNVNELTFIGDLISETGVRPYPKKVAAIFNMERPQCKQDVQKSLGMVNYQGKFIPDLATKSAPLRSLLNKQNQWTREDAQKKKRMVSTQGSSDKGTSATLLRLHKANQDFSRCFEKWTRRSNYCSNMTKIGFQSHMHQEQ